MSEHLFSCRTACSTPAPQRPGIGLTASVQPRAQGRAVAAALRTARPATQGAVGARGLIDSRLGMIESVLGSSAVFLMTKM